MPEVRTVEEHVRLALGGLVWQVTVQAAALEAAEAEVARLRALVAATAAGQPAAAGTVSVC